MPHPPSSSVSTEILGTAPPTPVRLADAQHSDLLRRRERNGYVGLGDLGIVLTDFGMAGDP